MDEGTSDLRWSIVRRLEFIEFRLYWEGGINRGDIVDQFGVSVPQASKDLSRYQDLAPDNMAYDKSLKRYFATVGFAPRFLRPDPNQYLSRLNAVGNLAISPDETWKSSLPYLGSLPTLHRRVDPDLLRPLLNAVRNERSMEILYQSMNPSRPEPVWRGVSPHAFANDGYRWHVRAFCHVDHIFKDFLLSRCLDYRLAGQVLAKSSEDTDWLEFFDVELIPNPKLSRTQQLVISHDYGMESGTLTVSVRKSLFFYFERHHRLDIADLFDRPQEVPVVIARRTTASSPNFASTGT